MDKISYYDVNKYFCEQFCEEFEKFKHDPKTEYMHGIYEIIQSMVGLTELEAAGAMREYFEDEHGYNSRTGEFPERDWSMPHRVWNAAPMRTMPPYYMQSNDHDVMPSMNYDGGVYNRDGYPSVRRDMNGMENRGRSRDSRGRYNEGYGVYNMAHEHKKDKLSEQEIQKWMSSLESENGERGPMWTKEEVEAIAKKEGIKFDKFSADALWAMANAMYSDYCNTGEKFNVDSPAFYISLAKDFLVDPDAIGGGDDGDKKMAVYYEEIAEH